MFKIQKRILVNKHLNIFIVAMHFAHLRNILHVKLNQVQDVHHRQIIIRLIVEQGVLVSGVSTQKFNESVISHSQPCWTNIGCGLKFLCCDSHLTSCVNNRLC